MGGRPINQNLSMARFLGDKTYHGSAHKKCGTTERYTSTMACVYCTRIIATEQREARKYLQRCGALDVTGADVEALDNDEPMVLEDSDNAEARSQQAIDDLM